MEIDPTIRRAMDEALQYIMDGSLARERAAEERAFLDSLTADQRAAERARREKEIQDLELSGSTFRARLAREHMQFIFA